MVRGKTIGKLSNQHQRFIDVAFAEAGASPHPKVKVGAVVTTADGKHILARAYNGFADGIKTKPTRLRDGEKSFWIMCAEKRALNFARRKLKKLGLDSLQGCRLYSTLDPCHTCADDLICAGIGGVFVPDAAHQHHPKLKEKWRKSITVGAAKLHEVKIPVTKLRYGDSKKTRR
jgi:dCMP deaminase